MKIIGLLAIFVVALIFGATFAGKKNLASIDKVEAPAQESITVTHFLPSGSIRVYRANDVRTENGRVTIYRKNKSWVVLYGCIDVRQTEPWYATSTFDETP